MSAAPFLAALLARAFPGLAARDLGLPPGRLLPWLPGTRGGPSRPAGAAAKPRCWPASARPGDRCSDWTRWPMPAADPAWDAAPERLAWRERPGRGRGRDADAAARRPRRDAGAPAGQARIMLLLGRNDRAGTACPAAGRSPAGRGLRPAARAAAGLAGTGWQVGGRLVSPRLASLGALAPEGAVRRMAVPAAGLPRTWRDPATLGGIRQARLLLGALPPQPWQLRLGFAGAAPGPVAFFLDGRRHPAGLTQATTSGEAGGTLSVRLAAADRPGAGARPRLARRRHPPGCAWPCWSSSG